MRDQQESNLEKAMYLVMKPVAILILALTVFDIRKLRRCLFLAQLLLTTERHAAQDVHAVLVIAEVRDSEDEDQNDLFLFSVEHANQ